MKGFEALAKYNGTRMQKCEGEVKVNIDIIIDRIRVNRIAFILYAFDGVFHCLLFSEHRSKKKD